MHNLPASAFESLRCFVHAARLLHFRAAAKVVALSPAALGQRIRQLEDQLGTPLFVRTTRSVALTAAGLRLLPYAEKALSAVDDCVQAAHGGIESAPTEIVLGTRHELGMSWVVPMLEHWREALPALTVHLYFGAASDLFHRVRGLSLDCAVTSARLVDPKLEEIALQPEHYVFVGQKKLLAHKPLRSASEAKDHVLLDINDELPLFRYWRDTPHGFDSLVFSRIVQLGTIAAIAHQVAHGHGVAVLPEYFVRADLKAGRLRRILPHVEPLSDSFRLAFRKDDPRRSLYARLAEVMKGVPLI